MDTSKGYKQIQNQVYWVGMHIQVIWLQFSVALNVQRKSIKKSKQQANQYG